MEPITFILTSALVAGAAKGAGKVGENAVVDSYAALKHLILTGYGHAAELARSIAAVEKEPKSEARKAFLKEELERENVGSDEEIVKAAQKVLAAARSENLSIGVDWEDISAAELKIGSIKAGANSTGMRMKNAEIDGKIEIDSIDAGDAPGK